MKLGFVGVGKHATKMAAAFRECGAEVVAFDKERLDIPAFGDFSTLRAMPWREQIASPNIGALIICAPPEVTTEVALACAKSGKRCVATKPLMWTTAPEVCPELLTVLDAYTFVDLWRLYSPAWLALKAELRGKQIQSVHVDFYGNGPVRGFSGLLDYGPHALAFVADLLGAIPEMTWTPDGEGRWAGAWGSGSECCGMVCAGNGWVESRRIVRVTCADGFICQWSEASLGARDVLTQIYETVRGNADDQLRVSSSLALRNFCRSFLAGEPSNTLRISCEAMRVLMPLTE